LSDEDRDVRGLKQMVEKKSDEEAKKKQRKGLVEKSGIYRLLNSDNFGQARRLKNSLLCRQDFIIWMI
jgi:hypothetical protein